MRRDGWLWLAAVGAGVLIFTRRVQASTNAGTGFDPVTDGTTASTPGVQVFAQAIAHAEGYGVPGSIPARANNPGDLVIPHWTGGSLGAEGISVFASSSDGWAHLYRQLELVRNGTSHVYDPGMAIIDFAWKWTRTQQDEWAANLVDYLNAHGYTVTVDTSVGDVLG